MNAQNSDGKIISEENNTLIPKNVPSDSSPVLDSPSPMARNARSEKADNDPSRPTATETIGPRVLIVGVGADEIPDLSTAIQQAKSNDTILIRHRGPLEFSSTDLTGKTPLTISGDEQGGVDYWPIIRQRVLTGDARNNSLKQDEGAAQPLFFGDHMELHLKKLHLACGGYGRERLASFIRCKSGNVSFEKCTLTASTDEAERFAEGLPLPLIELTGDVRDHLDLRFSECLIRGARLKSLVRISSDANVSIAAEQWLWAGGQGPLIELGAKSSRGSLKLKNCTIYNFASLVNLPVYRLLNNDRENLFDLALENSVLAAREQGSSALISISGGERPSLDKSRWKSLFHIKSHNSTLANIDELLPSMDRIKSITELGLLYELNGRKDLTDLVPSFRVFPAGVELQEVTALDMEIMEQPASKKQNDEREYPGIQATKLPIALPRVSERLPVDTVTAGKPRGLPKILEVSQKKGPLRSLEEAFNQIQGDDVEIVIADSETYVPKCDFSITKTTGILYSEQAGHLTIRAKKKQSPTIVLSDSSKSILGTVPGPIHWGDSTPNLFLISVRSQSLSLDGITFNMDITRNMRHSVFLTTAQSLRMTNCVVKDSSSQGQAIYESANGYGVISTLMPELPSESNQGGASIAWIENVLIEHPLTPSSSVSSEFIRLPTAFAMMLNRGTSGHIVFRNCFVGENQVLFFNRYMAPWVEVERCTLSGRLVSMYERLKSIRVWENIIFSLPNPVVSSNPGQVDSINPNGDRNALWMGLAPIPPEIRNQKELRWIPGESLLKRPDLNAYKLQGSQKASKMAEDGGPVGFRIERFAK
jgi:hypothetical protein